MSPAADPQQAGDQRDPEELVLELPALRLAALAWGPPDGAPVLALHGWMDSAASFARLAPHLVGVRVVAIDLAGHGRSAWRPPGVAYRFLDWVIDAHDAARALGWERFALLGHSLGAGMAVALAGTWSDRVTRLALVDGFTPRTQEPEALPGRLAEYVGRRDHAAKQPPRRFENLEQAAARLAEALSLPLDAARVLAERGTRRLGAGEGDGLTWARDPRVPVGPPERLSPAHIRAFLAEVRCPALLLRPSRGWPLSAEQAAEARDLLRGMQVVAIEGGHHVHLERPEDVGRCIAPFLAGEGDSRR